MSWTRLDVLLGWLSMVLLAIAGARALADRQLKTGVAWILAAAAIAAVTWIKATDRRRRQKR